MRSEGLRLARELVVDAGGFAGIADVTSAARAVHGAAA